MITKQFTPNVALFYLASRQIFHLSPLTALMYVALLGLPAVLAAFMLAGGHSLTQPVVPGLPVWALLAIGLCYALMLMPALQYLSVRRSVLSNPSANQQQNYEISEHGIRNFGSGVDVMLGWDKIVRLHRSRNFLLFFVSPRVAYFIPLSLITPAELAQIETWSGRRL